MGFSEWAENTARALLADVLPRRWAHVQGVAATARTLTPILDDNGEMLMAAALLHDIGYAPCVEDTGFHPLDGARYLRDMEHAESMLCRLVAHHSVAVKEAALRGLASALSQEFEPAPRNLTNALIYCDMTTGPDGRPMTVQERLADIRHRYGPEHVVTCALASSEPHIVRAVRSVEYKLSAYKMEGRQPWLVPIAAG
jgi:hypothetical protein